MTTTAVLTSRPALARGQIKSKTPDCIASEIALRPRGGRRRAHGPARHGDIVRQAGRSLATQPTTPRASMTVDGLLIDAFDAAEFIARHSTFWDASMVLGHRELAAAAFDEARANLARERRQTPHHWFASRQDKRQHRALRLMEQELMMCAGLLAEVRRLGLIDWY